MFNIVYVAVLPGLGLGVEVGLGVGVGVWLGLESAGCASPVGGHALLLNGAPQPEQHSGAGPSPCQLTWRATVTPAPNV